MKHLLYRRVLDVPSLHWGKQHEEEARQCYIQHLEKLETVRVTTSGLIVDIDKPCLGCSPDGIVEIGDDNKGLLEIKCPFRAAKEGMTPIEAAFSLKGFSCSTNFGKISLKRSHDYYYQVQGQMAILKVPWCGFFVWTPKGYSIERISRDDSFWEDVRPKLMEFTLRESFQSS